MPRNASLCPQLETGADDQSYGVGQQVGDGQAGQQAQDQRAADVDHQGAERVRGSGPGPDRTIDDESADGPETAGGDQQQDDDGAHAPARGLRRAAAQMPVVHTRKPTTTVVSAYAIAVAACPVRTSRSTSTASAL